MISRIVPLPGEEIFKRLTINEPLGEVIVHHSDTKICDSRWNTRSISLVRPRPTIGQVHLPLDIVEYNHLVMSTLLFYKEGVKKSLPDAGHSRLASEQFAGLLVFDQ